jgi:hypothetical protein
MYYEVDVSGESPVLVGVPLAALPAAVRGLQRQGRHDCHRWMGRRTEVALSYIAHGLMGE